MLRAEYISTESIKSADREVQKVQFLVLGRE
jgi:hypothetical protein